MIGPTEMIRRHLNRSTHRLRTLPVLVLMPHSRCNCRCVMCDIWKANQDGRELTVNDLRRHVDAIRQMHVQRIVLSGGEALMHGDLWALCAMLREAKTRITLLSSGILIARHAKEIVQWCDEVTVSLDGSRPVHDAIRSVPRAFDRLAAGVAALKAERQDFRVTGRCVLQRLNYEDLGNIIDAARCIRLDQVSFLAADVSSTAFNRPTGWSDVRVRDVALSPRQVEQFEQIVERVVAQKPEDFRSGFIAESPDRLRRLPRYYRALNEEGAFPEPVCNAPWVSAVVEPGGDVRPCFFHEPYGNLGNATLDDVLNSPEAVSFRRDLDVSKNATCRRCVCTLKLGMTKCA